MSQPNNPNPPDQDDFFIGWSNAMPKQDRRFFMMGGLALTAITAGTAGAAAYFQKAPGIGTWNQGAVKEWRGIVTAEPYAMIRTTDVTGAPKTVPLSCLGKCGVAARVGALAGKPTVITGSLIQRGRFAMIAVIDGPDWIKADPQTTEVDPSLAFPETQAVGAFQSEGEIIDTKCWFGAMRPSEGKVHKACAALCIRSGLPPALLVRDRQMRNQLLIITEDGAGVSHDILPFVGDPVSVSGQVYRAGDIAYLDLAMSGITRLT